MKQLLTLTPETFQEIYTNEEFRNQVAFAHSCHDSNGTFKYKKTCSYPIEYIVNEDQIKIAEAERLRAKKQALKDNASKLCFVGMGMTYEPNYEDDICNYRIRTEFTNSKGQNFFIEFGKGLNNQIHVDHSIDRNLESKCERKGINEQPYNNYKGLERNQDLPLYIKSNILDIVNNYFDCNFKEMVIDNYNLSTEDYKSISPKN